MTVASNLIPQAIFVIQTENNNHLDRGEIDTESQYHRPIRTNMALIKLCFALAQEKDFKWGWGVRGQARKGERERENR